MVDNYPCPACGFLVFSGPPGGFELCPVCDWEDDDVQLSHPRLQGGANGQSLMEAQAKAAKRYPLELQTADGFLRDPDWRPLKPAEAIFSESAPLSVENYFNALGEGAPGYYWRKQD